MNAIVEPARVAQPTPTTVPAAPSPAFVGGSWAALVVGAGAYLIGLLNATMPLVERGYYLTLLLFGLFAAVSVQKSVRDKLEGTEVTALYYGLAWAAVGSALLLVGIGLWNADLALSEKGFYGMAYTLALFAAVAVQKNVRDAAAARRHSAGAAGISTPRRWPLGG